MAAPIETSSYVVEHVGPWGASDITVRFDPTEFQPPAGRRDLIERTWENEQAQARRLGFEMFNGKLARLVWAAQEQLDQPGQPPPQSGEGSTGQQVARLEVMLQPTDFQTFLATNLLGADQFSPNERANAMGVSSIIRSADTRLVCSRRSERVAYHRGKLHTIGGVLDWIRPSGPAGGGADSPGSQSADGGWLFDQLIKELYEELGLAPEDIRSVTALALARDKHIWQPELLCVTEIGISGDELTDRWRQTSEYEHADLWGCHDSPPAIVEALTRDLADFTPIGIAALLAYLSIQHSQSGLDTLLGGG